MAVIFMDKKYLFYFLLQTISIVRMYWMKLLEKYAECVV